MGGSWRGPTQNHDSDVRRVLELLKKDQFVADQKKCRFFVPEIEFRGHILGGGERRPAPGKLRAIEKWELPQSVSALRAFLGFTNYYGSYIKDYAKIVARLMEKLKVPREIGKKAPNHPFCGSPRMYKLLKT